MIGVFGGTFDPVHYGHLEPARDVYEKLGLEKVLFIPNNIPPHRDQPNLGTAQRVELLQMALIEYPGFEIDLREVQREGPSWMVDTLSSLREEYPHQTFALIIGMDAFSELTSWHRWRDLLDLCHIIVTTRPGYELPMDLDAELHDRISTDASGLLEDSSGRILIQSTRLLPISATDIRERILAGDGVETLMPRTVHQKYQEMIGYHATR